MDVKLHWKPRGVPYLVWGCGELLRICFLEEMTLKSLEGAGQGMRME